MHMAYIRPTSLFSARTRVLFTEEAGFVERLTGRYV